MFLRFDPLRVLIIGVCLAPSVCAQETTYRAFECQHKTPTHLKKILLDILPEDQGRTRVLTDLKQKKVLVLGSAPTINMAEKILRNIDRPAVVGVGSQNVTNTSKSANKIGFREPSTKGPQRESRQPKKTVPETIVPDDSIQARFFRLNSKSAAVRSRLVNAFKNRVTLSNENTQYEVILFHLADGRSIEFDFDDGRQGVLVTSPANLISQSQRLLSALDSSSKISNGPRTTVVSIQRSDANRLQRAIDAYRGSPNTDDSSWNQSQRTGLALVNYIFQEEEDKPKLPEESNPSEAANKDDADVSNPAQTNQGAVAAGGFDVDVDVETLPDLDVIILRGSDRDVEKLTQIIQELERLSKETQPEVRIVQLQFAQSEAVAEIVESVREDLTGRRQGRVSLNPIVKPNAILLIGWGDAVEATIRLIRQLDTEVSPESQFAVFKIQHAPVTSIQSAVQQFFATRAGLGPRVTSLPDTRSNSLIVYAAPRDMQEVRRLVQSLDTPNSNKVNRARVFSIENALAADLAQTLQEAITASTGQGAAGGILELLTVDSEGERLVKSGILAGVKITANARNNTLIVSGPSESLPLIEALIRQLDSPGAVAQIKVFRIKNGDAAGLVQMLRTLLPAETGSPGGPKLPSTQGETSLAPLRFSVDSRTNSIIATGSEGDLEIIEALLIRLDQQDLAERQNEVYRLKNSPAIDVATAVNEFLRSERIVSLAAPGTDNPFDQIEREVIVVPEPIRNTLIISATRRYFDEIRRLIVELDAAPSQVLIQVLIAEIQLNEIQEFGVELGLQDSILFDRSLLGDLITTTNTTSTSTPAGIVTTTDEIIRAATNEPGFNFNNRPLGNSGSTQSFQNAGQVAPQALSHFAVGRMNNELGFGGLVLSASSESVSVLIRALQESRRLDVLSRPQVRTLDNQQAFIQVGQRVPRITATNITDGGLQTNSVVLENVGLILAVTPRVSPDGTVVMQLDAEKSSLGPEQEGIPVTVSVDGSVIRAPRINTTTAQTTVSAANGETIILGGLITKERSTVTRRVPYLADIPLLGDVFKFDSVANRRNELLIILTPHVIRGIDDSQKINQEEMAKLSWCAADVYDVHGDLGLTGFHKPFDNDGVEVIYPHVNPRGEKLEAPDPTELLETPNDAILENSMLPSNQTQNDVQSVSVEFDLRSEFDHPKKKKWWQIMRKKKK